MARQLSAVRLWPQPATLQNYYLCSSHPKMLDLCPDFIDQSTPPAPISRSGVRALTRYQGSGRWRAIRGQGSGRWRAIRGQGAGARSGVRALARYQGSGALTRYQGALARGQGALTRYQGAGRSALSGVRRAVRGQGADALSGGAGANNTIPSPFPKGRGLGVGFRHTKRP